MNLINIIFFTFLEIPDFLSAEECDHIIKLAGEQGLYESTTMPDPDEDEGDGEMPTNKKSDFHYKA